MRAFIHYRQQIEFSEPTRAVTQTLRLTPRSFDGQHVIDWYVGVEPDVWLRRGEDTFGNLTHSCSHEGPIEQLTILAEGEIETSDVAGVVHGQSERFPLDVYLRDAPPTHADAALREFTQEALAGDKEPLGRMHGLMAALHEKLAFEPGETPSPRDAADVFASGGGSARELAQVFIAAARAERVPARFVSGFFLGDAGPDEAGVHHGWAEAYVEPIGWIGFDVARGYCPRGEHVRVAVGLDYFGAAPRRSSHFGYTQEEASVSLSRELARQASWQDQQ
jgi:transglutaminase-like putative cysteine protease